MSGFDGHKNWNHWNVSLWLNNDEGLYGLMLDCISKEETKDKAARVLLSILKEMGLHETPDGAPYSVSAIRAAMVDY